MKTLKLPGKIDLLHFFKHQADYPVEVQLFVGTQVSIAFLCLSSLVIESFLNHYPQAMLIWVCGIIFSLAAAEIVLKKRHLHIVSSITSVTYTLLTFFGIYLSGSVLTPASLYAFLVILVVSFIARGALRHICIFFIIAFMVIFSTLEMNALMPGAREASSSIYLDWMLHFAVIALIIMWLINKVTTDLANYDRAIKKANAELYHHTITDPLTEVFNKRYLSEYSAAMQNETMKQDDTAILLIDIDFFKPYNDHYGHMKGDQCLKKVAEVLKRCAYRNSDAVFRIGGEEFLVILKGIGPAGLKKITKRIHKELAKEKIRHEKSEISDFLTVSIGTVYFADLPGVDITEILKVADDALYRAKKAGRNQTVEATLDTSQV